MKPARFKCGQVVFDLDERAHRRIRARTFKPSAWRGEDPRDTEENAPGWWYEFSGDIGVRVHEDDIRGLNRQELGE